MKGHLWKVKEAVGGWFRDIRDNKKWAEVVAWFKNVQTRSLFLPFCCRRLFSPFFLNERMCLFLSLSLSVVKMCGNLSTSRLPVSRLLLFSLFPWLAYATLLLSMAAPYLPSLSFHAHFPTSLDGSKTRRPLSSCRLEMKLEHRSETELHFHTEKERMDRWCVRGSFPPLYLENLLFLSPNVSRGKRTCGLSVSIPVYETERTNVKMHTHMTTIAVIPPKKVSLVLQKETLKNIYHNLVKRRKNVVRLNEKRVEKRRVCIWGQNSLANLLGVRVIEKGETLLPSKNGKKVKVVLFSPCVTSLR